MFNAVRKVGSLAMPVVRPNGLILTIFLILSLIADGAAQSSSQTASTVSQAASAASQVASVASQASLQASSQVGSQSPSQTLAQTSSQASESALPSTAEPIFSFDDSCKAEHRDIIDNTFKDAMENAKVTVESQTAYEEDTSFLNIYGKRATGNITVVKSAFPGVQQLPTPIPSGCNFDGSVPCNDRTIFPGIAKTVVGIQKRDGTLSQQSGLIFCREFFELTPLDHRVQMAINFPSNLTVRYNLGYVHDNQGE
ncbi:hypothetical protein BKA58DRAFT_138062 [Alternaria rosae]|uniref:uncharacterized protein n=1 Tax=Alternaria rosae TaxID=1187941 RepID=UPI001E8E8CD6|nr:uncharacterized protein BKA58DRAFT_138062 [Alternaria rosae]KAH6876253.1 hypothetical protein BKA58DRAFT_138062 [Alternaria rosae]